MPSGASRTILFVSGFSANLRARDLAYEFERYGRLVRCDIPALKSASSSPYAFVEFRSELAAEDAYYDMHGRSIEGRRISCQWAKNTPSSAWRYDSDSRGPPPPPRGTRGGDYDDRRRSPPPRRGRSPSPPRRDRERSRSPARRERSPSPGRSRRRSPSPPPRERERSPRREGPAAGESAATAASVEAADEGRKRREGEGEEE